MSKQESRVAEMCDQSHCRWEWRTFSSLPERSARDLGTFPELGPEHSKDIYLLGSQEEFNLKVRDGVLEAKQFVKSDANGLQLWCPIGAVRFPASAAAIAKLMAPFGSGISFDDPVTLQTFLNKITQCDDIQIVEVSKSRRKLYYKDCSAELARISINGQLRHTFCIESESQTTLLAALRQLELPAAENVSWPQYLAGHFCCVATTPSEPLRGNVEVERKFLVDTTKWQPPSTGVTFRQGYLSSEVERTVRVRTAADKGWLTIKGLSVGVTRPEFEYEIPFDDADWLIKNLCLPSIIEKTRYRHVIGGKTWEIDVFHGDNDGLIIAEIELHSPTEAFEKPEWATLEVSSDPKYFNNSLAIRPYKDWADS